MCPLSSESHGRRELWEDEREGKKRAPAGCHGEMFKGSRKEPLAFSLMVCLAPFITGNVFTISYFLCEKESQIFLHIESQLMVLIMHQLTLSQLKDEASRVPQLP